MRGDHRQNRLLAGRVVTWVVLACVALGMTGAGRARAAQPTGSFFGLGFESQASGLSADGSTLIGSSANHVPGSGFRLSAAGGGIQPLGLLPGATFTNPDYLSANGAIVVGTSEYRPFRWTSATGIQALETLPGAGLTTVTGITANGSTIVGHSYVYVGPSPYDAYTIGWVWTSTAGAIPFGPQGGTVNGINGDGTVIVGSQSHDLYQQAYRWSANPAGAPGEGTYDWLGDLPGGNQMSEPVAVSADGSVVIGRSSSARGLEGFRWTRAGGMEPLGDLPGGGFASWPHALSANGEVIVGSGSSFADPFIWTRSGGARSLKDVLIDDYGLDVSGWQLFSVRGISANGSIIMGDGWDPNGLLQIWVAVIPEPSSVALTALSMVALLRRRARSKTGSKTGTGSGTGTRSGTVLLSDTF